MPLPDEIRVYSEEGAPPVGCTTSDDLETALRRLHTECPAESPLCVMIEIPHYHVLLGVGADPTFVEVHAEPYDGEYYTSAGDSLREGWKDFYGCGRHTPFEQSSFIPFEEALAAAREFVEHQWRSSRIRWRDWNRHKV